RAVGDDDATSSPFFFSLASFFCLSLPAHLYHRHRLLSLSPNVSWRGAAPRQSGRPPFNAKKHGKNAMFRSIRAGDFVFHDDDWSHISTSAKKLVLGLLQVDPRSRLAPGEALDSEWMLTKDDVLRRRSLEKGLAKIVSFKARQKLKGAIAAVMYAVGGKFWNIDTAAIWREDMRTEGAVIADADSSSPPPAFDRLYRLDRKLQVGQCATVWEGTEIGTGKSCAIKVVQRVGLTQLEDAAVMNEVSILRSLRHENIVPLLDFFETPDRFCLIMEKCNGGDVLDKVASIEHYTEKDACQFSKGLLESDADNTSVKICDFGFAKRVHVPQSLTTLCGSLYYVAPELLKNHPYDESADMWSVGVIIFFLLAGYLPFHHRDQHELFKIIRLGKYSFDKKYWAEISEEATTLIVHLLDVDPSTRYSSTRALQSDWIKRMVDTMLDRHNLANSLTGISKECSRLKGVVRSVQWNCKNRNLSSLTADGVDFHALSELSNSLPCKNE
ncbi:hypothetical protein ACHAW5_003475, partial [Stephanodiscus triporus]